MVGLPCSGKTALARRLEQELGAVRLTPDEWHTRLFGFDVEEPDHEERHARIEALLWKMAARLLALGVDVILDFGFWARVEREDYRARAKQLGAGSEIHFLDVPEGELLNRLRARNSRLSAGEAWIPEPVFKSWLPIFQPPTLDELQPRN